MKRLLILLAMAGFAFAPSKLVKTKIGEGIVVSIPKELQPMTPDDVVLRYPSVRSPLGAFTNLDRNADFSVNISATQWPDENIDMAAKFFKSGIHNLYDKVDFITEGVQTINKKKFIVFEFESRVNGNRLKEGERQPILRYTYVEYHIEANKALVFAFNCAKDHREEWQTQVRSMMKSVKLK